MEKISLSAYAKINLTLDMLSKRSDGYHELLSFMQKISLCDIVTVEKCGDKGIFISCDSDEVPLDENNICHKAARAYMENAAIDQGIKINIEKHIPIAAGLAGGSADGAAVLSAMEKLFGAKCDINALASKLGADVNFCLSGNSAVCSGIGEKLDEIPFPQKSSLYITIAKGKKSLSTKMIYQLFDEKGEYKKSPATPMLTEAIREGREFYKFMQNDFEALAEKTAPEIALIKNILSESGAKAYMMSGSGPSVYGIFTEREKSISAAELLREKGFFAESCKFI